jgi:hypothetical protein
MQLQTGNRAKPSRNTAYNMTHDSIQKTITPTERIRTPHCLSAPPAGSHRDAFTPCAAKQLWGHLLLHTRNGDVGASYTLSIVAQYEDEP